MARKRILDLSALATAALTYMVEIHRPGQSGSEKITVEDLLEPEATARAAWDDAIIAGIGANADGSYDTPAGTNFLDASTDVMDALEILDSRINSFHNVYTAMIELDSADMHSCFATPIEIVAAGGASYYYEIISASAFLSFGTDGYLIPAGGKIVVQYDGGGNHLVEWGETFIEAVADTYNAGAFTSNVELLNNAKLEVTTTEQVTIDGNDDCVIKIQIAYIVRDNIITK